MDLRTRYLGLELPHPFMVGASPLADSVERAVDTVEAGAAAIVLRSLFEEQVDADALQHHRDLVAHADSQLETPASFPDPDDCVFGPDEYLDHLRRLALAVPAPVIASLNGYTPGDWVDYARRIEAAGARALELNLYLVATDPYETGAAIEDDALQLVRSVKQAVAIPVAVKLSPFYTALANFASRLVDAGADGMVLFNRFFEPDLDIEELEVRHHLEMSAPQELLLRLRWLAILSGSLGSCSLAASGGVHSIPDAVKALMAGADVVQLVSHVLQRGPGAIDQLRQGLVDWLVEHGYESLDQLRGSMNLARAPDPKAYERANYMHLLRTWRIDR